MAAEHWDEVKQLFAATLAQPADSREAWLADADVTPAIRAEARDLLASLDAAGEFLEGPWSPGLASAARLIASESKRAPRFAPGDTLSRYEILELLGAGGMGEVYRARDTRLDRVVVLKVLLAEMATRPESRARLEREARAVASLNHPHVCPLYDIGQHGDVDFLVMEYLEGETLAERLCRGALPVDDVLTCACQVAGALRAAHQLGIVHRDLKPANIMLTAVGAKLLDFGIAKPMPDESIASPTTDVGASLLTCHGTLVGTAEYMAPEQIQGAPVDARADIFSFGVVLYEMVTARKAFAGADRASVFDAVLTRELPAMSESRHGPVRALERVAQRCVAKDPGGRYQTALDLERELGFIAASRRIRRHRWLAAALIATAAAGAGLAWWSLTGERSTSIRQLPRIDGVNDLRALSPDGTKAIFIRYDKGQNLGVHEFGTGRSTLLTDFDWTADRVNYAISSPDGRRVAHMQAGASPAAVAELRITTLDGASRVIFRNDANPGRQVRPAAWLPAARALLVVVDRADGTSAIGYVPVDGGGFSPLRLLQGTGRTPDPPTASPDGRFVAFADGPAGRRDLHVISLDGGIADRITDHPSDDRQPRWSPDGRHVVFISSRFGSEALWSIEMRDGRPVGEPFRIRDGMHDTELIGWGGGGLAYVQAVRTDDIYTVSVDPSTGQPRAEPRQLSYARTGRNSGPVWSPDGKSLAFISSSAAEPSRRHVVVFTQDDRDPREFLIPSTTYGGPQAPYDLRWFGDGAGLGFSGNDAHGAQVLFRLALQTGDWKTYPLPVKTWTRIEWNADGSRYIYARHGARGVTSAIVEHDLASGQERVLFEDAMHSSVFRGLVFSPERRSVAFTASSIEGEQVLLRLIVVDTESGEETTVTQEAGGQRLETAVTLGKPTWSPDGRALLVPRTRGTNAWPELRVFPLDKAPERSLAFGKSFAGQTATGAGELGPSIRDLAWSPDGSRMAFVLSSTRIDAWMIGNVPGRRPLPPR